MQYQISSHIVDKIRRTIPGLRCLYFYGSRAAGEHTEDSDLDLAFHATKVFDPLRKFYFTSELASELSMEVDLVDMNNASPVFNYEVLTTGKLIFSANEVLTDWFELEVFQRYFTFQADRREIIEGLYERLNKYV